jgi:Tfp pilus assembly protein PilE
VKTTNVLLAVIAIILGVIALILWKDSHAADQRRAAQQQAIKDAEARERIHAEQKRQLERDTEIQKQKIRDEIGSRRAAEEQKQREAQREIDKLGEGITPAPITANPGTS